MSGNSLQPACKDNPLFLQYKSSGGRSFGAVGSGTMKKLIYEKIYHYRSISCFLLGSCGTHEHNHAEEGHDHEAEAAHGHDEHDHEAEEAHKGASNEIVLTPEKAEAAGVKVETVEPVLSVR